MRLVYISNFNSNGVSNLLNIGENSSDITKTVSNAVITEINQRLPERKKLHHTHPEWIKDNTLVILDNTEIKITFIDEGAGYKNSFGYYIYDTINPPKTVYDIEDVYIIFPNSSKLGSGGTLQTGDTMQLAYEFTTQTSGNLIVGTPSNYIFPKNKSVGFIIIANGWRSNNQNVNKNAKRYFTDSTLNTESVDWLKGHTALVKLNTEELLMMGLEDLPRNKSYCDHDFNDLIVLIECNLSSLSENTYSKDIDDINDPPTEYNVGYKKCFVDVVENSENKVAEVIVTLHIPPTSQIIKHNYSNKIRTDRAYVVSIVGSNKMYIKHNSANDSYIGRSFNTCHSSTDDTYVYTKNDWVTSTLDTNKEINGQGIHYFASYEEARDYVFNY